MCLTSDISDSKCHHVINYYPIRLLYYILLELSHDLLMAKNVLCEVAVTLTADLCSPKSNVFVPWTFAPNLKKFPQGIVEIMVFMRMGQHDDQNDLWPPKCSSSSHSGCLSESEDILELSRSHEWVMYGYYQLGGFI